jgi:hypothetical protein
MARKTDPAKLAAMREREPVLAPDFARAEEAPERDGHAPLLPQPCPVTPLGVLGKNILFLDRLNQVVETGPEVRKGELKLWFGNEWLKNHFEQRPKGWKEGDPIDKFDQDDAQTALVEDCVRRGIFNPQGRVFGRGTHRFPGDEAVLALHMGNQVMLVNAPDPKRTDKKKMKRLDKPVITTPGEIIGEGGKQAFFPAMQKLPPAADSASTAEDGRALLTMLETRWYWVEPRSSGLILLGHIVQMFICGALDWRAHVWLAAPTASGKSYLQKLIRAIHDEWCLATEDSSEAAIRQVLGDDTLPVMIDEAEAHDKPERLAAILNLMKKACSGAKMYRGSTDHKAQGFTAQSCFLLSSVLHANMKGEDRNRIAILEMRAIPVDAEPLELEMAAWVQLGKRMRRRVIDQWRRFDRTLRAYKKEIASRGYEGRWQDTYGTFLACADLVLYDYGVDDLIPDENFVGIERVKQHVSEILPAMARGRAEARSDVDRCLVHLTSHLLPGAHGKAPESVGCWIERAMTLKEVASGQFITSGTHTEVDEEARAKLKSYGLRVLNIVDKGKGQLGYADARPEDWASAWLAVAYPTSKPLCEVFRGSEWADGGWLQSLGKVNFAGVAAKKWTQKVRFSGSSDNALLVPLKAFGIQEE